LALAASPRIPGRLTGGAFPSSDDPDEVTGATLDSGETGGTWTKARWPLGVTAGSDGGLAVLVAEMPTTGTISADSVNPNSPRPGNSVS
jgi:hypothetical protein